MLFEETETAEGTNLARAAITAARDDATVLTSASFALWNFNADAEMALRVLDRAVELNPNLATAWLQWYRACLCRGPRGCDRALRLGNAAQPAGPFEVALS